MHLVHFPHGRSAARLDATSRPQRCPECGHPAAVLARTPLTRALQRVRASDECHYAMFEYSVLRDEACGCRSAAHAV